MRLTDKEWQILSGKKPKKEKLIIAGGYTSNVRGWRTIGGKKCYFKSLWEINYAHYLEWLKTNGSIKDWFYEPKIFSFPKDAYKAGPYHYKPDYIIINLDDTYKWHEVKGYLNPSSKKKIKRFHKHHPKEGEIVLIGKTWFTKEAKKLKGLIPNWEKFSPS